MTWGWGPIYGPALAFRQIFRGFGIVVVINVRLGLWAAGGAYVARPRAGAPGGDLRSGRVVWAPKRRERSRDSRIRSESKLKIF